MTLGQLIHKLIDFEIDYGDVEVRLRDGRGMLVPSPDIAVFIYRLDDAEYIDISPAGN